MGRSRSMVENSSSTSLTKVIKKLRSLRQFSHLHNALWTSLLNSKLCSNIYIRIMILNTPCYGFGDVIFAVKFSSYLLDWYPNADIKIATTNVRGFQLMGIPNDNLIQLLTDKRGSHKKECRRFKFLTTDEDLEADLYFIAPLSQDFFPDFSDIRKLIPQSNKFNTFILSEYNDFKDKKIDFHTGVGSKRFGLLLTNPSIGPPLEKLPYPYAVAYIAIKDINENENEAHCFVNFLNLVCSKYNYPVFDFISQDWVFEDISELVQGQPALKVLDNPWRVKNYDIQPKAIKPTIQNYPNVVLVNKNGQVETIIHREDGGNTLRLRADILPMPHVDMLRLIKYSVEDILLTGDQSITDALSCCGGREDVSLSSTSSRRQSYTKNIFYQSVPWKRNFAYNLGRNLPNKYLLSRKTTCGTLKAIKYKSNYSGFLKVWDFRRLARPKLDAIILSIEVLIREPELYEILLKARTLKNLKKRINEVYF